jgi:acid stress chaperone HdeB
VTRTIGKIRLRSKIEQEPEQQAVLASWLSGYYHASKNVATVDIRKAERNLKVITKYCKGHKKETLMSAVEKQAR